MTTMSAAESRMKAKNEYNAFLAVCPSRKLLERISDKWVALVLCGLGNGDTSPAGTEGGGAPRSMRYSEISRLLAGVSQKMLTQTLRSLERDGLLVRTVTPTVPVTVTYELTDLGLSLHQTVRGLKAWAENHMDDVFANRAEHDASHA
jgi:DNA-binding HxlR family transcriptional regulator